MSDARVEPNLRGPWMGHEVFVQFRSKCIENLDPTAIRSRRIADEKALPRKICSPSIIL
jgi:hypothetical protein